MWSRVSLNRDAICGVARGYGVMVGMLRERFMMRRTSTSGRLSCLVWAQPSSAAAMRRSKRSDTDFFLSLGFPLKKEPSHCLITLSIFSVLETKVCSRSAALDRSVGASPCVRVCVGVTWRAKIKKQRLSQVTLPALGTWNASTSNTNRKKKRQNSHVALSWERVRASRQRLNFTARAACLQDRLRPWKADTRDYCMDKSMW